MSQLIEFPLDGGGTIRVQVPREAGTVRAARAGELAATAQQTIEKALGQLKPVAATLVGNLRDLAQPPDQVSVELGVILSAEAGIIIASGTTEANFTVRLEWSRPTDSAA